MLAYRVATLPQPSPTGIYPLGENDAASYARQFRLGAADATTRERVICSNGDIPDTVLAAALIPIRHYKSLCKSVLRRS